MNLHKTIFIQVMYLLSISGFRMIVSGFLHTTPIHVHSQPMKTSSFAGKEKSINYRKRIRTQSSSLNLNSSTISHAASTFQLQPSIIVNHKYSTVSLMLLIGYHIQLAMKEKGGVISWRKAQADTREKWAVYVRETEGWLYAVQTLRNAITANTFLATTVLSLLTLIAGRIWDILRKSLAGDSGRNRLITQFVAISICMLASAYEFLQSARLMTHAGFMFPVVPGTKVDGIMRRSQNSQWMGLRWLYLSLGTVAWTVGGDKVFFIASLLLVYFFNRADKPPSERVQ